MQAEMRKHKVIEDSDEEHEDAPPAAPHGEQSKVNLEFSPQSTPPSALTKLSVSSTGQISWTSIDLSSSSNEVYRRAQSPNTRRS